MSKPNPEEYAPRFQNYIDYVDTTDLMGALESQREILEKFLPGIPEICHDFAYAPGKWTLREVLQHLIDCERIFAYRALAIARGESQSLPSFEENIYAENSSAKFRTWAELCEELQLVRLCTLMLFRSFTQETLAMVGTVGEQPLGVKATGFIISGHLAHHVQTIKTKYLKTQLAD